jgi:enoyl-CoA hydratase
MSEAPVLLERLDGGAIALVTINRPDALNALNAEVLLELAGLLVELSGDEELRCLVLTGAGRAFVAGADIAHMSELSPRGALEFARLGHEVLATLETFPHPVIAAVNGFALGGGCEITLACDLVYASEKAKFGQPEVKLGLIPGFGGTQRLARRVGAMRAAELIFSGRMVRADEAKAIGLALDVVPPGDLMGAALARAREISEMGPVAVRAAKRVQYQGLQAPLPVGNALERQAFATLFDTADAKEGMIAFVEKRNPKFTNA